MVNIGGNWGSPTARCLRRGVGLEKLAIICSNQPTQPPKSRDLRQEVALRMIWWSSGGSVQILHYFQVNRGFLWVFEVHLGFLHINIVEIRPQGRTGCENLPPGLTHMSQCDYVPVSSPCISEAGNKTKDFGRQLIAWHQLVYTRSNQVEDFKSLLLKKTELIYVIHQSWYMCPFHLV